MIPLYHVECPECEGWGEYTERSDRVSVCGYCLGTGLVSLHRYNDWHEHNPGHLAEPVLISQINPPAWAAREQP